MNGKNNVDKKSVFQRFNKSLENLFKKQAGDGGDDARYKKEKAPT